MTWDSACTVIPQLRSLFVQVASLMDFAWLRYCFHPTMPRFASSAVRTFLGGGGYGGRVLSMKTLRVKDEANHDITGASGSPKKLPDFQATLMFRYDYRRGFCLKGWF